MQLFIFTLNELSETGLSLITGFFLKQSFKMFDGLQYRVLSQASTFPPLEPA